LTRLAVAAAETYAELSLDWPLLRAALDDLGVTASAQVWTDPHVPWDSFDLVLANGAWDNIHQPEAFRRWTQAAAALTTIVNSPTTLRWNLDKRYLSDLQSAGVPIVPTTWLDPHSVNGPAELPDSEIVIKPSVSGGGFQTARYQPAEHTEATAHIDRLHQAGRTAMVQHYQSTVDAQGELGLIFLGGRYSHTINKGPMLRRGEGSQVSLFHNEVITAAEPTSAHRQVAHHALTVAEDLHGPTTYARVDLVLLADGSPGVLELELLDPALFLSAEPTAAGRLAEVLVKTLGEVSREDPGRGSS
jgi:glutathione synthase/RimK-type ligase-like ATP-grasp enzyme